jgi:hypothetical protein
MRWQRVSCNYFKFFHDRPTAQWPMTATVFKFVLGVAGALLLLGFGIGSSLPMPGYARVYLDDDAKTYIATPCLAGWQQQKSQTMSFLRLGTASEAIGLGYGSDRLCRETGAFVEDDRSLTGLLLEKVGILPPIRHWWDAPYRTEDGAVVQPGR